MSERSTRYRLGLLSGVSLTRYALIGGAFIGPFPNAPAYAQEAQVDDVRVTSGVGELSKRKLEVLRIPRPIVVVDPKTAEREQLYRLEDFAEKVPNYRPNIDNPRTSRPAIRGVSRGAGTGDGSEFDTGFLVDNVFWKHVGFQWANFIDTESFEIALGPQGTNGGKNTTVGAVVIRTQLPSFERKATLETQFGNYSHVLQQANVTGPIIDDKLAYRVAAYFDKGDGWFRDQASGASLLDNNRFGVRGQLLYVGDNFTDRLIFNHSQSNEYNNNGSGPFGNSFQIFANGTLPARTYAQTVAQRLGRPILTYDPYRPYNTRNGVLDQRTFQVSNELNVNLGENTLTSVSAYGFFRLNPVNSFGNQLLEISGGASDTYVEQFSQEVRISSPKDQPLEWVGGVYAFYEYVWNRSNTIYGSDAAQWFSRPALLNRARSNRDGKARDFQVAAYGNVTWHYDENLALTLGLRDSYEIKEGSNFAWQVWYPGAGYSFLDQYQAIRGAGGAAQGYYDTGGKSQYHNFITAIVNPQYRYNENILVYAIAGYGEKAGAVNTGAQPIYSGNDFKAFQDVVTKPEVSADYEIGVKTNWLDEKLILNLNFYWNDLYNFQSNLTDTSYSDSLGQPIRATYLGVVKRARLRGFEFDGRWNPVERLWINFSGAVTEARWIDFQNAPTPSDWLWPTPANPPAGFVAAPLTFSLSNTRWDNLPVWAFNVGFNYEQPLGSLFAGVGDWANRPVTGFIYSNLAWQDKALLTGPFDVFQYWQKPYPKVNFGFGLRTDDDRYSLNFWAKNIFDERPVTSWSPGNQTSPATIGLPKTPRTFGGTFRVKLY